MIQAYDTICSFALAQIDSIGALDREAGGKLKSLATVKMKMQASVGYILYTYSVTIGR